MMCKLKGGWIREGIMMWKLKKQMDKVVHYVVEMKGWMEKVAL